MQKINCNIKKCFFIREISVTVVVSITLFLDTSWDRDITHWGCWLHSGPCATCGEFSSSHRIFVPFIRFNVVPPLEGTVGFCITKEIDTFIEGDADRVGLTPVEFQRRGIGNLGYFFRQQSFGKYVLVWIVYPILERGDAENVSSSAHFFNRQTTSSS